MTHFKVIAILLGLSIIFLTVIVIGTSLTSTPSPTQSPAPLPKTVQPTSFPNLAPPSISPTASLDTSFNTYSEDYLRQQEEATKQEQQIATQSLLVSHFVDKLPVQGQYIKVTYNIYNNQVYLEYNRIDKKKALAEFVNLLKQNQIEDVKWLYNLKIIEL